MRILWICGLPRQVQREVLQDQDYGAHVEWSWILGHLPPPDGVELHIACRVARHAKPIDFMYRGAHFHLIPVKTRGRVLFLFRFDWIFFRRLMTRLNPDVVHGWGTEDAYASIALKLSPEQHVIEIQGNLNEYRRRVKMPALTALAALNERLVLARARHVAAENGYSMGSALSMIRTGSLHIVEHPIRPEFLDGPQNDSESRQICYLGNIEERKGIWDAIEAFRAGAPSDWSLAIIGSGGPAPLEKLRQMTDGLGARVRHFPRLNPREIIEVARASSIFLLPTRIDTGPTALKESLALGLWPVCYDNSGPGHYIRKFEYGDLAEDLNREALTSTLRAAISSGKRKAQTNRDKIRTSIRPHFDRLRIWQELEVMYRQIAGRSRP